MKRAVIASILAVAAIAAFGVVPALSGNGQSKPDGAALGEDRSKPPPPPVPGEPVVSSPPVFFVGTNVQPPRGVMCPDAWRYFDNPVLHVGICYPSGWGFTDMREREPMTTVPSVALPALHLMSAAAFPLDPEMSGFDAVARRGAVAIEIGQLDAGARFTTGCVPEARTMAGAVSLLSCESPTDDALVRQLVVVAPLKQTPLRTHEIAPKPGARLIVIARIPAATYLKEVETVWQIVRALRPY